MSDEKKESDERQGGDEKREVSPWEWVAAFVSAVVVLAAIGFLALEEIQRGDAPPAIEIADIRVVQGPAGFLVEFTAHNTGDQTVAALHVEGQIGAEGNPIATSQTVIDYVPAGGKRDGGLFFDQDPRTARLRVRPMGYEVP